MPEKMEITVSLRNQAARGLAALSAGFSALGRSVTKMINPLTLAVAGIAGVTAAVATSIAVVTSSIKTFITFDDTMRAVGAVSGATAEEMEDLTKIAKEMGRTTKFTASQAGDGLRFMAMAGFEAKEAIDALPGVLNLAAAAGIDLGQSADIATNVLSGFGLQVEDLSQVNDVLVKTFTTSNSTLSELGEGFKLVGPIAKGVGADFEDLVGALGQLHNAGLKGTIAGTSLRGVISALMNPTAQETRLMAGLQDRLGGVALQVKDAEGKFIGFEKVLAQLEKAGFRGEEALALFGDRAGPGIAALLNVGSDALGDYIDSLRDVNGVTDEVANRMEEGLGGAVRRVKSAMEAVKLSIARVFDKDLLYIVEDLAIAIGDLALKIDEWADSGKIAEWADVAVQSIQMVWGWTKKLAETFLWAGKLLGAITLKMNGYDEAAKNAADDALDSWKKLWGTFQEEEVQETVRYKINQITGATMDSYGTEDYDADYGTDARGPIGTGGFVQKTSAGGTAEGEAATVSAAALLKSEAKKLQAIIETEIQANESLYNQGLISLATYYEGKEDLIRQSVENEIDLLKKQSDAAEDPDKRQEINDKIFSLEQQLQRDLLKLTDQRLRDELRLKQDAVKKEEDLKKAQILAETAFAQLKERVLAGSQGDQAAKFQEELGELQERQNAELAVYQEGKMAKAEIDEFYRLQELEKKQLLEDQYKRLTLARLESASLVATGVASIFSDMYELTGKKNKELFYLSKAASLAEATINIATGITKAWGQGGMYGAIGAAAVAAAGAVQIAKIVSSSFAAGGEVPGHSPTSTSDNIIARLTAGEFVQPVSSVRYYGAEAMEAIRQRLVPREALFGYKSPTLSMPGRRGFASGGAVAQGGGEMGSGRNQEPVVINNNNILDPGQLSQHMATSTGQQDVWNVLTNNPHKLKNLVFAQ